MRQSVYKSYLLTVLMVILASNYADRFALGVLLQGIKSDFSLTDTQLGLLSGIAFALFYATMGIPIARWADRGNRVTIIALTTALWGMGVALCAVAANFIQLLLIRVVVGVGEAGCQPPALSLISDYFARGQRPRAVSRYMLGIPLATVFANLVGGWSNELYGWRTTFTVLAVPGIVLAIVAKLTLKEPRREKPSSPESSGDSAPGAPLPSTPFGEVFATLWANPSFRNLLFSFSLISFFAYGINQWLPAFFMRTHGLSSGQVGSWTAATSITVSFVGTYLGGEVASRYAAGNERLQLLGLAILYSALAVVKAFVYLAPNYYWAFAALALANLGGAAGNGPLFAATQTLVPPQMRATSMAILLFFSNLIGMGLGPLSAGALSDALHPRFAEDSLRYALLLLCPGYLWAAWYLWQASKGVRDALSHSRATATLKADSATEIHSEG